MEKKPSKFKLAIISSKEQPVIQKLLDKKLDSFFDYDLIGSVEQIKSMVSPTQYEACFVVSGASTVPIHQVKPILEEIILRSPNLTWVHSYMAGVDYLFTDALIKSKSIVLTNARGAYDASLVEFVLLSIIYFAKKMHLFQKFKTEHKYQKLIVNDASNAKVGIIGYGSIGKNTAILLKKSINAKIYAIKSSPSSDPDDKELLHFIGQEADLPYVLSEVDYVVNILPLTPKTQHYFNLSVFKQMKPNTVFINIGRGSSVVEKDLVEALKTGIIYGAGLDVYDVEPLPSESPLYDLDNVLMSPHSMGHTMLYWDHCLESFEEELKNFLSKKPFKNTVDMSKGY